MRAVRTGLDIATAQTLIRAASFLVGSITIEEPLLDVVRLKNTLSAATMAILLGNEENATRGIVPPVIELL